MNNSIVPPWLKFSNKAIHIGEIWLQATSTFVKDYDNGLVKSNFRIKDTGIMQPNYKGGKARKK